MSSSSDIEKLFDHFGGDANAYQEIGRENEARSARTRWPLLVTLDLRQPTIPAIGQRREARPRSPESEAPVAVDRQDAAPKDTASVTRAKAPLFARSHRRDIPPVAVAVASSVPRGASRFGEFEMKEGAKDEAPAATAKASQAAVPARAAPSAAAHPQPQQAPEHPLAPPAQFAQSASAPPASASRRPVAQTFPPAAKGWEQAAAPASAYATASAAQSAPILGKLFAAQSSGASAPPQSAAAASESASLQAVFDRLRGTPGQSHTTPSAAPSAANSWLVNGSRRS